MIERLQQANDSVKEGEFLYRENLGNKIVLAKLYHAMMYCLFVLFDIRDIGSLTHADIIERFEREYVRTGMIDNAILVVLRRVYDLTHECDGDHMPVSTDEETDAAQRAAEGLLRAVEGLLKMEVRVNEGSAV